MTTNIEYLRDYAKREFDRADMKHSGFPHYYRYHLQAVREWALKLAKKYNVDPEVLEAAVYLHHIGLVNGVVMNHKEKSAMMAEELLTKMSYPRDFVQKVKVCIATADNPLSQEAKVFATAHSMARLTGPWYFVKARTTKELDDFLDWCKTKVERDYALIQFDEEREAARRNYEALKEMLK